MEEKRIFQRQKKKKTYFHWKKENIPKVIKKHIFDLNLIIISIEILLKEKKKTNMKYINTKKMKYKYKYPKEGNYLKL